MQGNSEGSELDLTHLADEVCRRGLAVPAIFLLELHKPLTTLAHGALTVSAPLLGSLFGAKRIQGALALLSNRENVEKLITLIETTQSESRTCS